MNSSELVAEFEKNTRNSKGIRAFFAPGRVNLIGEHIDYNGGGLSVRAQCGNVGDRAQDAMTE
jgi:galactokinase